RPASIATMSSSCSCRRKCRPRSSKRDRSSTATRSWRSRRRNGRPSSAARWSRRSTGSAPGPGPVPFRHQAVTFVCKAGSGRYDETGKNNLSVALAKDAAGNYSVRFSAAGRNMTPAHGNEARDASRASKVMRMTDLDLLFDSQVSATPVAVPPLHWGAPTAAERGPLIAARDPAQRNVMGTYAGGYSIYRALAIAARNLPSGHRPDLTDTAPAERIGPHPQWAGTDKIVSLDPWGHLVGDVFRAERERGLDIRPTIAVTRAHIDMPEIRAAF